MINTGDYTNKMEIYLILVVTFLCGIVFYNLFKRLRNILAWRVNCWFCNCYVWVKFPDRNSWTCPKCEQYNGFTKDGDYNKPLMFSNDTYKTPRVSKNSPARNGFCKMCNINQQLKVTQLANFVPMNEKNYDEEIETYRSQLEKAYKLCSPCKRVLQTKLHKEKETLLSSKAIETRTPEKKRPSRGNQRHVVTTILNVTTKLITAILLILTVIDFYTVVVNDENLFITVINIKEIINILYKRVITILETKLSLTFPSLDSYKGFVTDKINFYYDDVANLVMEYSNVRCLDRISEMAQEGLGGLACLIQIFGHLFKVNNMWNAVVVDSALTAFVLACIMQPHSTLNPLTVASVKILCISTVLFMSKNTQKAVARTPAKRSPPKRLKNLTNKTLTPQLDGDTSNSNLDSDDDVSLTKFGLHNFTDSSNENMNIKNSSFNSGRVFSPRNHSVWTSPKMNSTFCTNSLISKSPSCVPEIVFAKPSFDAYQKYDRDSDSDIDESISSLCIGSAKKCKKMNSMFSLRKFTATPSFVAPNVVPVSRGRPIISPSKLGHGASWVAGGYWGSESDRLFSVEGSRSSSQSSGFESQASSINQRTVFSQPPSREESVCGEERNTLMDRFQNCSVGVGGFSFQGRVGSPVFPQMQYNSHVYIPQPRLAPSRPAPAPHYPQSSFKAPPGSRLFNLPQFDSFSTR